jgi:UDP-GlcNAc:undecaprenyl-phosphate GlcNAc-1-phosphate transferase
MFVAFTFCLLILDDVSFSRFGSFLAATALLIVVGLIDDLRELPWYIRFATQIIAALIMTLGGGVVVEDLGAITGHGSVKLGIWAIPFTVFATVGLINALNMLDGLDGLAGGISLIAFSLLAFVAMAGGQVVDGSILILLACIVGAFLLFNLRLPWRGRALAFMGDAGSTFLGFALAWFVISLSQGEGRAMTPVTALWILALPIVDTVSLLIRRMLAGRSPFAADRAHLHHILLLAGHSVNNTNIILWSVALILGSLGVLALYQNIAEHILFYGLLGLSLLYLWHVMRLERGKMANPKPIEIQSEN